MCLQVLICLFKKSCLQNCDRDKTETFLFQTLEAAAAEAVAANFLIKRVNFEKKKNQKKKLVINPRNKMHK